VRSPVRMSYYDGLLAAAGHPAPARYAPEEFEKLLAAEHPDAVIVTLPGSHPSALRCRGAGVGLRRHLREGGRD
jgi:hypothetical protein